MINQYVRGMLLVVILSFVWVDDGVAQEAPSRMSVSTMEGATPSHLLEEARQNPQKEEETRLINFDHATLDTILRKYVNQKGEVDYRGLKANEKDYSLFKKYTSETLASPFSKRTIATLEAKKSKALLATYINAYNAFVIQAILDHKIPKSPLDVKDFFDAKKWNIFGKKVSLNELEHQRIRAKFQEPGIHFLLVCGAKSCPRLRPYALTPQNITRELKDSAVEFVRRTTSLKESTLTTSKIFEWYATDFVPRRHQQEVKEGKKDARDYVKAYVVERLGEKEKPTQLPEKIIFSDYNWSLNEQSR